MRTVFLSYRRRDSRDATRAIFAALAREFGSQHVFRDVDSIPVGVDFRAVIEDEIVRSDVMIVVIGPQWLHLADAKGNRLLDQPGDFVRAEISRAIELQLPVIGALIENAEAPPADQLPPAIRPLAECRFVNLAIADSGEDDGLRQLVDFIRATSKSTRDLTIRERYAATTALAWQAALTSTLLAALLGGIAVWLAWQGWRIDREVVLGLLAAMVLSGILAGWRAAGWLGALAGVVLMPLATLSAVLLSLMCAVAPLLPIVVWIGFTTDLNIMVLSTAFTVSFAGNLSGLYGLKRAADARARRRKVSGAVLRIVGWWSLGVALVYVTVGIPVYLLQTMGGQSTPPALRALLGISACCCIATPLGALFGLAWRLSDRHLPLRIAGHNDVVDLPENQDDPHRGSLIPDIHR